MHLLLKTKWTLLLLLLFLAPGCIDEDLSKCPKGLSVGFTYNLYNEEMEYADAFNNAVSDVTLLVFDAEGLYISRHKEEGDALKQRDYSMNITSLPSGSYQLLAWGGVDGRSFIGNDLIEGVSTLADVLVILNTVKDGKSREYLPSLFYGRGTLDNFKKNRYREVVVPLIKNTNTFRILLQNDGGQPINPDHFRFRIIDRNRVLDFQNNVADDSEVIYKPSAQGAFGTEEDTRQGEELSPIVFAELSTSRLFAKHSRSARFSIYNTNQDKEILNIPIIEMVLLMKQERFTKTISNQDYLDRIHSYYMTFFLHNDEWMDTRVVVNGWMLRLNEVGEF